MMNNFENLLKEHNSITNIDETKKKDNCEIPCGGTGKNMQRAKKSASLYEFLDMVAKITDYAMSEQNVEFLTDERQNILKHPEFAINKPYISYRVISRKPKNEYKPIVREDVIECDENNVQRAGSIFGQHFDCIIQFNVFASESRLANEVMEKFEELILSYAGFFKEQGVVDLYFKEQLTDSDYNNFRETLSVRNIRYYVQIEKLAVIFNRRVTDVTVIGTVANKKDNK